MVEHTKIRSLSDFFLTKSQRTSDTVYFYRICGYNDNVEAFIGEYYEAARKNGVVQSGKLANPDGKKLSFFTEMMGDEFQLDEDFINQSLNRWLPRMTGTQRCVVAEALYTTLLALKNYGKNDAVIKNSYIKFMCWLYYRFEGIVNRIGLDAVPKLLYEGELGFYDLFILNILSHVGCDVVLLQYDSGVCYDKLDPEGVLSDKLDLPDAASFPDGFSLKTVSDNLEKKAQIERLYGTKPDILNCTNAWLTGEILEDILKAPVTRGSDPRLFYNAFCRMYGVSDKVTFQNEIYRFYLDIKNSGRGYCIIENSIPLPSDNEVHMLKRSSYTDLYKMISELSCNISFSQNVQLQRQAVKAFVDVLLDEAKREDMNLNRLTSQALYALCWLNRYSVPLFNNWQMPFVSVFIMLGGCSTESEAMFCRLLSRLPCDVLLLVPNLNTKCVAADDLLYEELNRQSLNMTAFPTESSGLQIATAAYHAERELDELMYTDTGMYRNQQFSKANCITLKTMYEEISILWKQELRFRPNFSTYDNTVNMPVIFAKVSGVKDGNKNKYWQTVRSLLTEDTVFVSGVPFIPPDAPNPFSYEVAAFFRNGMLQRRAIAQSRNYRYGLLRTETQNYIFDKLQLLIDSRVINGTFTNGMEYNIISVVLNMNTELIRLIQKFDFTRTNPKLIYVNTGEYHITLQDSIMAAFLNLVGFDVIFFVPTGYQTVEKFYTRSILEEHQTGEYMYDLQTPKMKLPPPKPTGKKNGFKNIFKKGK